MGHVKKGTKKGRKRTRDSLLGRTAVAGLLDCDRKTLTDLEKKGDLVPSFVDSKGARWYAPEVVLAFAVKWKKLRRKRKPKRAPRKEGASPRVKSTVSKETPYNPDPVRRASQKDPSTVVPDVAPYDPDPVGRAGATPSVTSDEAPPPSATKRPASPITKEEKASEPERSSDDFKPKENRPPRAPSVASKGMREIVFKAEWFNDDYQPPPSER